MKREAEACKPILRPTIFYDIHELASRMRKEDVQEIQHYSGRTPLDAVTRGVAISNESLTVTYEDSVVLIVGIVETGDCGVPWMLATDDLSKIRKSFLRGCKDLQMRWLKEYGRLENYVWTGNEAHIQWLRWLGFSFDEPQVHGVGGELFQRFYMKEQDV